MQPQTRNNGAIAQLVEQRTENPCVPGSIPGGTTLKRVFGKETEMRTLLGTMNEEIEKMKKAVNIDYAPVTLDKSDKKVGLSFL